MELNEAKTIAAGLAGKLAPEEVELGSAEGRVLAESVPAGRDVPGSAHSKWDGFALMSAASKAAGAGGPVVLEIAPGEVTAGKIPERLPGGKCIRIMCGGLLPAGADAVIPFEDSTVGAEGLVLRSPVRGGAGVVARGSRALADEILLEEGDLLTPSRIALAATAGRSILSVVRRPRVAVLATGNELRRPGEPGDIASSFCNSMPLFGGLAAACGAEPIDFGIAPDDPAAIQSVLQGTGADLVVTTGGMGGGSMDFIREVWKRLGLTIHIDGLNLVPGHGSAMAAGNGSLFLGLPGNPWAGRIVFEEIGATVIRRFLGLRSPGNFSLKARSLGRIEKKKGFHQAFEGSLVSGADACLGFIPNRTGKGARRTISSLRMGLAYVLLGPDCSEVSEGETVEVKVPDLPLQSWAALNPR